MSNHNPVWSDNSIGHSRNDGGPDVKILGACNGYAGMKHMLVKSLDLVNRGIAFLETRIQQGYAGFMSSWGDFLYTKASLISVMKRAVDAKLVLLGMCTVCTSRQF